MEIIERKMALGTTRIYAEGPCKLKSFFDPNGKVLMYRLEHENPIFAPDVSIISKNDEVKITLSFRHIVVDFQAIERVEQTIKEIKEFCAKCEEKGAFKIV